MSDDDTLMCCACHQEPALPGAFLGERCCPEPEPDPEPEAVQMGLFEVLVA